MITKIMQVFEPPTCVVVQGLQGSCQGIRTFILDRNPLWWRVRCVFNYTSGENGAWVMVYHTREAAAKKITEEILAAEREMRWDIQKQRL